MDFPAAGAAVAGLPVAPHDAVAGLHVLDSVVHVFEGLAEEAVAVGALGERDLQGLVGLRELAVVGFVLRRRPLRLRVAGRADAELGEGRGARRSLEFAELFLQGGDAALQAGVPFRSSRTSRRSSSSPSAI